MPGSAAFLPRVNRDSDLIGIPVVLGAILAFLAILVAFFFIGPVVGVIVVLAVAVLAVWLVVRFIRANEVE